MSTALLEERSTQEHRQRDRGWAGPWLRVRVFLARLKLDRALAGGADPSWRPELALRAEQLRQPRVRGRIAKGLDRLAELAFADPRRHVGPALLPFRHQRVRPNIERVQQLADALRATGPHAIKGVAMASTLLEDGRGPLYASDPAEKLGEVLDATISELKAEDG